MKKYSASYSFTNSNFAIQNLPVKEEVNEYLSAISIIKNILQRGNPTIMSKYLQTELGALHNLDDFKLKEPLISRTSPKWERIIRGDVKNNYFPAKTFYEEIVPKLISDGAVIQQLLVPEVPINEITKIDVEEFTGQQVDFYLPQAFLVIEIDGAQHNEAKDSIRDNHLAKYGIKTIRFTTNEIKEQGDVFKSKIVKINERISQATNSITKISNNNPAIISIADYVKAYNSNYDNASKVKSTTIIRFQILILELLSSSVLKFDNTWKIACLFDDDFQFEEIAIKDLELWFSNLFRLMKIPFSGIDYDVKRVQSVGELEREDGIKIDFSVLKRYTDEFQTHPNIIFVRGDYFDYYQYYKNTNAVKPEFVALHQQDYFAVSSAELINYRFQFKGENDDESSLSFFLNNIFGYSKFNQGQLPIITNALMRNDTIGLLPTGGGKSICYQLTALLQPAISFVVCPIKSLMYDQKQDLDSIYFSRVNHITSDDDGEDKERIMSDFANGKYMFLFISPERFQVKSFRQYLLNVSQNHKISYAVIDEVHCLSEWGHDFRTSYLNLSKTIKKYCKDFRYIGLTATASINVLKDIQVEFGIKSENVKTLTDYTRAELEFDVIDDKNNKVEELVRILQELNDREEVLSAKGTDSKCGLIFTATVNGGKGCYKISSILEQKFGVPIKFYSGQVPVINQQALMSNDDFETYKKKVQSDFKKNEFTLLAATKAFGMGVNKGNIHYTIHFGIPGSMEALYQEAGRAGREKKRFIDKKAKCFVLFSKSENEESLERVWDRETNLSELTDLMPKIKGDINTNLFLFASGMDVIKDEYALILKFLNTYGKSNSKDIQVSAREIGSNKFKTEKSIYRLSQLGIIEDWTISNFFRGEFEVDFKAFNEASILASLKETINKYDKDFDFDKLEDNDAYIKYKSIWSKNAPLIDKCIVLLLQWAYDHFAYNRRQSLKNIYENCDDFVIGKISKQEFKERIENYFKFSEVSYVLQHIAENPNDYRRWFEVFYEIEKNKVTNQIIRREQRQSLLANLSRFLESYEFNTGLDFVSGVIRLLVDDFEDVDGEGRLDTAFKAILKYEQIEIDCIIDNLLIIGGAMSFKSKNQLAKFLIKRFGEKFNIVSKIQSELGDDYSTEIMLNELNKRLLNVNTILYDEFEKIR